jgi:hypothetical protein
VRNGWREAIRLENQLRADYLDKQVTVLYDSILDLTTVRIDPQGLPLGLYVEAARADEQAFADGLR